MTRKIAVLFIFIFLSAVAFLARDTLISYTFQWYLKGYCLNCLDGTLTYESVHYENGEWVFDHPMIATNEELGQGGYKFKAEKATVDVTINWLPRLINLKISAEFPHFDIGKEAAELKKILSSSSNEFMFFHVHTYIDVPHGSCQIHDSSLDKRSSLFYSIDLACKSKRTGVISLWLDDNAPESQVVDILLVENDDGVFGFKVDFKELESALLWQSFNWALPQLEGLTLTQGEMTGSIYIWIPDHLPVYAEGNIIAENVKLTVSDFNCELVVPKVKMDLLPVPSELGNGQEILTSGHVELGQGAHAIFRGEGKPIWEIDLIQADLEFDQGMLKRSVFKGGSRGLCGDVIIDGTGEGPFITFRLGGRSSDIAQVFPEMLISEVQKQFKDDQIKVSGTADKYKNGVSVTGKIHFNAPGSVGEEVGFSAKVSSANSRLVILDGKFDAVRLPLEKYVSPFIFPKKNLSLSGFGDFHGQFDEKEITVCYNGDDVILKNSDFSLDVKELKVSHEAYAGVQFFDLEKNLTYGTLDVRNGIYFEKNSGLLFTDVSASLTIEDGLLRAIDLETFSNGIHFKGCSEVDWRMPGDGIFSVDISIKQLEGRMSQLQQLLSHFKKPIVFSKVPLDGNILLRKGGGRLHFDFEPNDYHLQTFFSGALHDGVLTCQVPDLSVQEISVDFDYDHSANTLVFTDLLGTVLMGSSMHYDEYTLTSDQIAFTDYEKHESRFDIKLDKKQQGVIRLKGNTHGTIDDAISVVLDIKESHFCGLHPTSFVLDLKEWSDIEVFQLGFNFSINTLIANLQCFSQSGLFFLNRSLLKELHDMPGSEGSFKAGFGYDGSRSVFTYDISGRDINFGVRRVKEFLLTGKKKGSVWTVDQLQLDEISLAMDILKEAELWNINFLGGRFGDALLFGLEGQYDAEERHITTKVNLFEGDLAVLSSYVASLSPNKNHAAIERLGWSWIIQTLETWPVKGNLFAKGDVNVNLSDGFDVEMKLVCSLKNGQVKDVCFHDIDDIPFHYTPQSGCVFGDIHTMLKSSLDDVWRISLFLKEGRYHFSEHKLLVENLRFLVPQTNLGWCSERLNDHFPLLVSPSGAKVIAGIKQDGNLEGSLRFALQRRDSMPDSKFEAVGTIILDDGQYHMMDRNLDLSQLLIRFNPLSLTISTRFLHEGNFYFLEGKSVGPEFINGEIVISDDPKSKYPLTVYWKEDLLAGYYINKIKGSLSGITCDLSSDLMPQDQIDSVVLDGVIEIDMGKVANVFNTEAKSKLMKWQIGNGYTLQGRWQINKDNSKSFADNVFFNGYLWGRDFDLLEYKFQQMFSECTYTPQNITIDHLVVTDPALNVEISSIRCVAQNDGNWQISMPTFLMNEFHLSELSSIGTPGSSTISQTLVIRKLEVNDFTGILSKPETYSGKGYLTFTNMPKKNSHIPILEIPLEILMRIGLDLSVLNPVKGRIDYRIKDSRVEFITFKDVYSKGKVSKFYLSNTGTPSFVDFDGNLHMQVRMKQYNLLFKLAELFTVTVQGTLKEPTYTLQKQPKGR